MDDRKCAEVLSMHQVPKSDLLEECEQLNDLTKGVNSYRRLLPAHYADGLSKV